MQAVQTPARRSAFVAPPGRPAHRKINTGASLKRSSVVVVLAGTGCRMHDWPSLRMPANAGPPTGDHLAVRCDARSAAEVPGSCASPSGAYDRLQPTSVPAPTTAVQCTAHLQDSVVPRSPYGLHRALQRGTGFCVKRLIGARPSKPLPGLGLRQPTQSTIAEARPTHFCTAERKTAP
jgi:hypothetical protein